jgi:hypothetical protein
MVSKVVYLQNNVRPAQTRQYMMIQASKPMGNQQETLLSQNCSSMEIYISSKETMTTAN